MTPELQDYTGYDYRKDFWEKTDRRYEDLLEKETVTSLLAHFASGDSYMDLGCGFGRLTPVYAPLAKKIILFDYAQNLLNQAKETWGQDPRFQFIQGDARELSNVSDLSLNVVLSIRTLHHLPDYDRVFAQVYRVLAPGGIFIVEIPNKRHIRNILRFACGKQANIFSSAPLVLGNAFFNYHPNEVKKAIITAGFSIKTCRALSFFRVPLLKKHIPPKILVKADQIMQKILGWTWITPSIYCVAEKKL